jgi:hypothetical protein
MYMQVLGNTEFLREIIGEKRAKTTTLESPIVVHIVVGAKKNP